MYIYIYVIDSQRWVDCIKASTFPSVCKIACAKVCLSFILLQKTKIDIIYRIYEFYAIIIIIFVYFA